MIVSVVFMNKKKGDEGQRPSPPVRMDRKEQVYTLMPRYMFIILFFEDFSKESKNCFN